MIATLRSLLAARSAALRNTLARLALFLIIALGVSAPPARAEQRPARRFALVAGVNDGGASRVRLRYAGADAQAVAKVLQQLGGVAPADLTILIEPDRASLEAAVRALGPRLQAARADAGRVELVVYYSGHSDEEALLPRGEPWPYASLRAALDALPADVRVTILDSCASGALTRLKGGRSRPPFLLDASSSVKGQAILTSASADEAAQESDRIGGSYFTQALLTGLRGAADMQRSGRVTLNDAYQYAFADTLARTERTQAGPQHPAYEMQLVGSGDLVMTDLRGTSAGLVLPADLKGRVMVRDAAERLVVELRKPAGRAIDLGLEAGEVRITVDDGGLLREAKLQLADGKRTELLASTLSAVTRESAVARGDLPASSFAPGAPGPLGGVQAPADGPTVFSVGVLPTGGETIDNAFALNLGVGRFRSLRGVDLGLGGSIYLGDVSWLQANVGVSWADGSASGLQTAAGLVYSGGDVRGLQATSGVAVARGTVNGLQGSTLFSWAGAVHGIQGSSGLVMANGEVHGLQGAAGATLAGGELHGFQGAAGLVWTGGEMHGFQGAGAVAYATGNVLGAQLSGLASIARDVVRGLQGSGGVNYAPEVHGAQLGTVNVASGTVHGAQIGMVNVSEDTPVAIGLFSWVKKGQHHVALTGSELGPALEGKLGGSVVYTIYSVGWTPLDSKNRVRFGFGVGGHIELTDRFFLELEGLGASVHEEGDWQGHNFLATGRALLGFRFAGDLAVVAGPSWNTFVAWDDRLNDFGYGTLYTKPGAHTVRNWPGVSAGLQF